MTQTLLTAAQMRAAEQAAMDTGRVTGLQLMERAGRAVMAAILDEWPALATTPGRAIILCGPGNNGGDGYVIARLLRDRGWDVTVVDLVSSATPPPDAAANRQRWVEQGGPLYPSLEDVPFDGPLRSADLVVDAVFGTGLTRGLGPIHRMVSDAFSRGDGPLPRLVAVDIPSGLCADSGRVIGAATGETTPPYPFKAALTVTFHTAKPGHLLADGPNLCGHVKVADIGLDDAAAVPGGPVRLVTDTAARNLRKATGHKYDHGHVLVLTGGMGRTGAARLAARAALRVGAGLVTLAAPGGAMLECATQITALMLRRCDDADALKALLEDERLNALCLGPGLGTGDREAMLVETALRCAQTTVLDADALTLIAGDRGLRAALHPRCVLTPHMGEFARLFPDIAARLTKTPEQGPAYSKVDAVRDAAAQSGATILLKGPDTVIADPSGDAAIHAATGKRATPWLATAGAGDVLAGIIAGLLARGIGPLPAAVTGAWLHVEAARSVGPGLIAEDLPDAIPAVLRACEA